MVISNATKTQVSILGSSFLQPTADLISKLCAEPKPRIKSANSTPYEQGYSASIVLLLVAMLESYVVRVRYIQGKSVPDKERTALAVLEHCYPKFRNQFALTEVYILRDVIFHNHLWEIQYTWNEKPGSKLTSAAKHPAFGDKKYDTRVDLARRRTKTLGLSIIPTSVNRTDAMKVFKTVWKTLLYLESKNRDQCSVSNLYVRFNRQTVLFSDLIKQF